MDKTFAMYGTLITAVSEGVPGNVTDSLIKIGAPTSEIATVTADNIWNGSLYQNYTSGYLLLEKGYPLLKTFTDGVQYDGTVPVDAVKNAAAAQNAAEREAQWRKNPDYIKWLNAHGAAAGAGLFAVLTAAAIAFAVVRRFVK
jgi:hypothetical protein